MLKNKKNLNQIILGDALQILPQLEANSIDIVLTDPPYFLDKLDNNWDYKKVNNIKNLGVVRSLPAGMKFDKQQGKNFYDWYFKIAKELYRVLKPGGFFFSFSSPRLYHRLVSAVDDAGFNIRDCLIWLYTQNQAKAMGLNHFIKKNKSSEKEKKALMEKIDGWKTPQLKSCFEPIMFAQKPVEKKFLENMIAYEVGLLNTNAKLGENMFPANVLSTDKIHPITDRCFLVPKPKKEERGSFNDHQTVKPLSLCEHLLRLSAFSKKTTVLDPFLGSGTTALATKNLGLNYIGIEINPEYVEIVKKRLGNINNYKKFEQQDQQFDLFDFLPITEPKRNYAITS